MGNNCCAVNEVVLRARKPPSSSRPRQTRNPLRHEYGSTTNSTSSPLTEVSTAATEVRIGHPVLSSVSSVGGHDAPGPNAQTPVCDDTLSHPAEACVRGALSNLEEVFSHASQRGALHTLMPTFGCQDAS